MTQTMRYDVLKTCMEEWIDHRPASGPSLVSEMRRSEVYTSINYLKI